MESVSLEGIDLLGLESHRDGPPHAAFARLRREDPVHWHPEEGGSGFWAVTRYHDVVRVSRDSETFSSERGGTMAWDADEAQLIGLRQMMLNMDPPRHSKLRAIVNKGFTPRRVAELRGRIGALSRAIVDEALAKEAFDFVEDVAGELPSYVIAELMGIPLDDGRELYRLTERMHTTDRSEAGRMDGALAIGEMMNYSRRVQAERRAKPGDDIVSALLAAEVDGEKLSEFELDMFFMLLINAGGDTTRNLVGGGMEALFEHPEERARLQRDLGLLDSAVEEMLRWVTPVIHFRRTATRDATLGERQIRAGDKVVVFYTSANRDEEIFPEPDRFDVGRTPNEHVAFGGGGTHYCLGANLARLEGRTMLGEVLRRMPDLVRTGPIERLHSNFIHGPRRMPVSVRPRAGAT
ncbi:MAG: cytochrome P450 [Deltaproteobacteria bacterium]|nr:cytochrome P450 [Deltaproteobacteria bacterium]